jgi:hypothetical protein
VATRPVPKDVKEINNPYEKPRYEVQNEEFETVILANSHQRSQ